MGALPPLLAAAIFFTGVRTQAAPELHVFSSEDVLPAPRWSIGQGGPPRPGQDIASTLAQIKWQQLNGEFAKCVQNARLAQGRARSLAAWLAAIELDCALRQPMNVANADSLARSLETVTAHQNWLFRGSEANLLKNNFVRASLVLIEQDIKTNRLRAWSAIERLQEFNVFVEQKSRARMWRFAGELSFVQQKPEAAYDFFKRSLREADDPDIRGKLTAVEATLKAEAKSYVRDSSRSSGGDANLEASSEEIQLVERATFALKSGDFLPAVDDAMKLIVGYPGGSRAQWAQERILEAYLSFADRTEDKYQLVREQFLRKMERADSDRLEDWARTLYSKGFFSEAYQFASEALKSRTGARRAKLLELASDAAIATEHFDAARDYNQELIEKCAGTPQARRALLRIALLFYRRQEYGQTIAYLERLLVLPQIESLELVARYWLWRALEKTKSERAAESVELLIKRFPFSYYGLKARFEGNSGVLEIPEMLKRTGDHQQVGERDRINQSTSTSTISTAKSREKNSSGAMRVESRLWLTGPERIVYEKFMLLLRAGWLDEAQAELKELPLPARGEDRAVRALLWAAASGYVTAAQLTANAWDENPGFRRSPFIESVFPREFGALIAKNADARRLDRDLVRGLIKQESGFNLRAISTSNAFGLMQLIAPTAREVAADLKIPSLQVPDDLFKPSVNIELGTQYLAKMLTKYKGHVPLALAAYNAGPQRIDRWLRTRPSLKNLTVKQTSEADQELWFDEIPFSETNFYVKAILRNLLLYKVLEQGRVEINDPIWAPIAAEPTD